jgi:lysophospholipase L1-like esterase
MKILLSVILILFAGISVSGQTKIMAIGESTTADPSSYRKKFYELATAEGLSIDMVGPNSGGTGYDADNAGYYGKTCLDLTNFLQSFYKNYSPEIVILLVGTNDCGWNYRIYPNITPIDALSILIDSICVKYPDALIFVSSIPPMLDNAFTGPDQTPSGVAQANGVTYNNAMQGMINTKIASGEKVHFIDARGLLNATDILSDGIHPNQNGYNKLGVLYYNTIKPYILKTIKVYPNPVLNYTLKIDLPSDLTENVLLNIYSMTGSMVFYQNCIKYTSPITISLPKTLPFGLYLLTIKYKAITYKKKIIILS